MHVGGKARNQKNLWVRERHVSRAPGKAGAASPADTLSAGPGGGPGALHPEVGHAAGGTGCGGRLGRSSSHARQSPQQPGGSALTSAPWQGPPPGQASLQSARPPRNGHSQPSPSGVLVATLPFLSLLQGRLGAMGTRVPHTPCPGTRSPAQKLPAAGTGSWVGRVGPPLGGAWT